MEGKCDGCTNFSISLFHLRSLFPKQAPGRHIQMVLYSAPPPPANKRAKIAREISRGCPGGCLICAAVAAIAVGCAGRTETKLVTRRQSGVTKERREIFPRRQPSHYNNRCRFTEEGWRLVSELAFFLRLTLN